MAYSTPFNLTQRGFGINTGATTSDLYPHSAMVAQTPVRVASFRFKGADATAAKGAAVAVNDVFQLIKVPAGAFVLGVTSKVVTAEGGTCTFSIGDGSATAGFISAQNGNSVATAFSWDETPATLATTYGVGHFYGAADTIDLLVASGTAAAVVVDVSVTYIETMPNAA